MTTFPSINEKWSQFSSDSTVEHWWKRAVGSAVSWLSQNHSGVSEWMSWMTKHRDHMIQQTWESSIPADYRPGLTYVVLGSGGRNEDLLGSDFDYAVLLDPRLDMAKVAPYLEGYTARMHDMGFPLCKGFVLGTNPRWIGTRNEWQQRIDSYFAFPDWENARYLFILLDGRPLCGINNGFCDGGDWGGILNRTRRGISESPFICWEMAHLGIHKTVAVNRFGRIRSEKGQRRVTVNVKEGLLNPIIHSVRLLAVVHQCGGLSTLDRLEELVSIGIVEASFAVRLEAALEFGWRLRLKQQIEDFQRQTATSDQIFVNDLDSASLEKLTIHLETAKELERWTHRSFPKPR